MSVWRHERRIDEPITLSRVVTRGGDPGSTSLANGLRVLMCDPRVEVYGAAARSRRHCMTAARESTVVRCTIRTEFDT